MGPATTTLGLGSAAKRLAPRSLARRISGPAKALQTAPLLGLIPRDRIGRLKPPFPLASASSRYVIFASPNANLPPDPVDITTKIEIKIF